MSKAQKKKTRSPIKKIIDPADDEKEVSRRVEEHDHREYAAARMSVDVKEAFVKQYLAQAEGGMSRAEVKAFMRKADYNVSKRTFDRWIKRMETSGVVKQPSSNVGRPALLNEEERDTMAGYVLWCNQNHIVRLSDYQRKAAELYGVQMTHTTAANYLAEAGFASKVALPRPAGYFAARG